MCPLGQQQKKKSWFERRRKSSTENGACRIAGGNREVKFHELDYTRLCFLPQEIC